jgi:hypothetical protein
MPTVPADRVSRSRPQADSQFMEMAEALIVDRIREDEQSFQQGIRNTEWFKEFVKEHGEEPDLDTKDYNYREAWRSGARPDVRDPTDKNRLHWPSKFKGENHPRRFINGRDTRE